MLRADMWPVKWTGHMREGADRMGQVVRCIAQIHWKSLHGCCAHFSKAFIVLYVHLRGAKMMCPK